jgi:ELWxxDGT repeat protein
MSSLTKGAAFNGWFYFAANEGVKGVELWRTDGSADGTKIFMDIIPGSGSSDPVNFKVASIQVNLQTSTNLLFIFHRRRWYDRNRIVGCRWDP